MDALLTVGRNVGLAVAMAEAMTGQPVESLAVASLWDAATGEPVSSVAASLLEAQSWTRTFLPTPATDIHGAPAITTAAFGFLEPGASAGGPVSIAAIATTVLPPTGAEAGLSEDLNKDFADAANLKLCRQ